MGGGGRGQAGGHGAGQGARRQVGGETRGGAWHAGAGHHVRGEAGHLTAGQLGHLTGGQPDVGLAGGQLAGEARRGHHAGGEALAGPRRGEAWVQAGVAGRPGGALGGGEAGGTVRPKLLLLLLRGHTDTVTRIRKSKIKYNKVFDANLMLYNVNILIGN